MQPKVIAKAPEGEGCPRCGGFVYAAEQMLARGRVRMKLLYKIRKKTSKLKQGWHKRCFKCNNCTRTLDSTLHCDGPDREVYCRGTYLCPRFLSYIRSVL